MAEKRRDEGAGEAPRTDLPPTREPYTDDYFGTGEEEGVVRERDAGEAEPAEPADVERPRAKKAAEEAAGGDREIL